MTTACRTEADGLTRWPRSAAPPLPERISHEAEPAPKAFGQFERMASGEVSRGGQ